MLWGDMGWVGWVKFLTACSRQLLKPFTIYFMREKKLIISKFKLLSFVGIDA